MNQQEVAERPRNPYSVEETRWRMSGRWSLVVGLLVLVMNLDAAESPGKRPLKSPHDRMVEALKLSPEQRTRWDAAYAGLRRVAADRRKYSREEYFAKLREEGKKAGAALKEILTPEQREIYDQIKNARQAESVGKQGAKAPRPFARKGVRMMKARGDE